MSDHNHVWTEGDVCGKCGVKLCCKLIVPIGMLCLLTDGHEGEHFNPNRNEKLDSINKEYRLPYYKPEDIYKILP